MPDLEPITREEMLLDGQDLEPITRKEMFIKRIYDKTQVIPEPITREEMFLKKAGDETTDVTIEQLNVSENGTYSEEGKAYSPVIVNVPAPPIPDNAYLLNDVEGLPKDIVTFNDGANLPMPSLKVDIEPIQEGSGDPSPSNIRPISGWDEVNVGVSGVNVWDEEWEIISNTLYSKNYIPVKPNTQYYMTPHQGRDYICLDSQFNVVRGWTWLSSLYPTFTTPSNCYYIKFRMTSDYGTTYNNDISINYPSNDTSYHAYNGHTYTIDLDGTRYGGTLNVVSGVMTVDRVEVIFDGSNDEEWAINNNCHCTYVANIKQSATQSATNFITIANEYKSVGVRYRDDITEGGIAKTIGANNQIAIKDTNYSTNESWREFLASKPLQVVYELATHQTYQLTPTQVNSLLGSNNVWADCGEILEGQYFSKEE